jgi:hypothetical protein
MISGLLIAVLVAAVIGAAIAGPRALRPPAQPSQRPLVRRAYVSLLVLATVAAVGTTIATWSQLSTRMMISLFAVDCLGLLLSEIGFMALHTLREVRAGWQETYTNQIYFSYLLLWEGLLVMAIANSPLSPWVIPFAAIGLAIAGAALFRLYEDRDAQQALLAWLVRHVGPGASAAARTVATSVLQTSRPPASNHR